MTSLARCWPAAPWRAASRSAASRFAAAVPTVAGPASAGMANPLELCAASGLRTIGHEAQDPSTGLARRHLVFFLVPAGPARAASDLAHWVRTRFPAHRDLVVPGPPGPCLCIAADRTTSPLHRQRRRYIPFAPVRYHRALCKDG